MYQISSDQGIMTLRRAQPNDYTSIAKLHRDRITTGFLSSLGLPFLSRLYEAINNEAGAYVLVAEEKNDIVGFIAGAADVRGLYKKILLKRWFFVIVPLIRYMCDAAVVRKMVETALYGFKRDTSEQSTGTCAAELLSVAVGNELQGRGIGKKMVMELETVFKENDVAKYKVVTFSLDGLSNRFYTSCDFRFAKTFTHHGNLMNEYIKEIP